MEIKWAIQIRMYKANIQRYGRYVEVSSYIDS